jgi:hypothetical protein
MPPKKIRRVTSPIEGTDKDKSFVGILNGRAALIDVGSGLEDESLLTGEVDVDALRELGLSDEEIEKRQQDLDEQIDEQLFGNTLKAYTRSEDADDEEENN